MLLSSIIAKTCNLPDIYSLSISDTGLFSNSSDLTIEVIEYGEEIQRYYNKPPVILRRARFQVSRDILVRNSEFFKKLTDPKNHFKEASQDLVLLKDVRVSTIRI